MKTVSSRKFALIACVAALAAGSTFYSSAQTGDPWYPSKWGAQDELGAANLLTPQRALAAAQLVRTGKTYSLGVPVSASFPTSATRGCRLYVVPYPPNPAAPTVSGHDDLLNCWNGIGTQIDGLGHAGISGFFYNGNKQDDILSLAGLRKLGVDKIPPMVTRGVLLDMAALFATDVVKEGTAFNRKEIDDAATRQGIQIREGDVVLFHTGWLSLVGKDDRRYLSGEPGLGKEGALYLASKGVVAIGADNWALEAVPWERGVTVFEIHQTLLAKNGIYILENIATAELAQDKAYEFMFVLGQNKYRGAVQSMVNPIAIR